MAPKQSIEERSDGRTVQLKGVRLSYCDSLKDKKPTTKDGSGKLKHTVNVILDPASPNFEENKKKCVAALEAAGEQFKKKPGLFRQLMEDEWKRCSFRKGDRMKNGEGVVREHYKGGYWIGGAGPKAGENRPVIKGRDKRIIGYDQILDVCYGGVFADVVISFYGTDKGGSDGIFNSIEVIRSYERGERFAEGGGVHVDDDDFDDLDDDEDFLGSGSSSGGDLEEL